ARARSTPASSRICCADQVPPSPSSMTYYSITPGSSGSQASLATYARWRQRSSEATSGRGGRSRGTPIVSRPRPGACCQSWAGWGVVVSGRGGGEGLVRGGGGGEPSSAVGGEPCSPFRFRGLRPDAEKNVASPPDTDIAAADAAVRAVVVRTREDWIIARDCW